MDVPQIIAGRFRIEREIGTGGMGTVYRATHLGLERPVAVKIIKPEFASDPDVTERFMREARTMARLRHPHAAFIFDAGNLPDGRHFIVMEFVEGETLSDVLVKEGRFTPQRAVRIASDICDVLAEAHRLGIVHRDLKPSNIMLNERGVCVLDFGVAKVLATSADATATHATTGSGIIIGTPRYMSPEQCLGQSIGARSDLYSLGVLVYEMLAGRPPFVDLLSSAVLIKQATAPPPPLPQVCEGVSRSLAIAVHTLLAKRPEDRPRTADDARAMLEKSIARPRQEGMETEPFASTVAALNTGRSVVFRAFTPVVILAALGALLFVWGRTPQTSPRAASLAFDAAPATATATNATTTAATTSRDASSLASAQPKMLNAQMPSLDAARRIVGSMSHDRLGDVRVLRTPQATALVALHDERREGTSHLYVMERRGASGNFHLVSKPMLDARDFRGAQWTAESMDADGDGFEEVLYTGTNARNATGFRLVLYVPRTHQSYAVRVEKGERAEKGLRAVWSTNALAPEAQLYRTALQQRLRTLLFERQAGSRRDEG
ncbi:MAG: eukaryotic-like serine/threonine-protein kinase [Blastocatellia bacterium]|jgi:serine/threonine protein kinase|nr:eukaryotic-like serine/threonine-protein kinase [Blastocatellia bacterium]